MTDKSVMIPQPNRVLQRLSRMYYRLVHPVYRWRVNRPGMVQVDGLALATMPGVFHPVIMRAGVMLGRAADQLGPPPSHARNRALDMGCGSGVVGAFLARNGYETVCVDVDSEAVRLARANAILNGLDGRMNIRQGDLFTPVMEETFDVICFSPPYFEGKPKSERLGRAFWSEGLMARFAVELPAYLKPDGVALVHLSTDGDPERFLEPATEAGMSVTVHSRKVFLNEIMTVYAVRHGGSEGER